MRFEEERPIDGRPTVHYALTREEWERALSALGGRPSRSGAGSEPDQPGMVFYGMGSRSAAWFRCAGA